MKQNLMIWGIYILKLNIVPSFDSNYVDTSKFDNVEIGDLKELGKL